MSHHSSEPFDGERPEFIRKMLSDLKGSTSQFRGPIGAYPDGMLTKQDEGSIQFAIGEKDGKVVLDFGAPVAWIGVTPQQAMDIASALMKRAREAAAKAGQTIHVTIGG